LKQKNYDELIEIRNLEQNYGHRVYITLKDTLPDVYLLSDPDLELNKNLPDNFVEILYELSKKYETYKVGFALDISDHENFIDCPNYNSGLNIYTWESRFWHNKIEDEKYEIYNAPIDTTFCLVNEKNFDLNKPHDYHNAIRLAGDFTTKHLPWYKDYIKNNIPQEEIEIWKKNNKSSSLLVTCMNL